MFDNNPTRPGEFVLGEMADEAHFPYELRWITETESVRITSFRNLAFSTLVVDALADVMVIWHPESQMWEAGKIMPTAESAEEFVTLASSEDRAMCLALLLENILDVLTDRKTLPK